MGRNKKTKSKSELPFVSVCTPTFNRRPFIEGIIKCFKHQNYPASRMEWIIIDDGTDKVEDLFANIDVESDVKYFKYHEKMSLGKKRNLMHSKCSGEIIVYMDDDDYYPPERVSHAVDMLVTHPKVLCAGSSEIYIYFNALEKVYQFGPYSSTHATAGTFAFKRKLLDDHAYDNDAALAEEKAFLKNYTVPFIQLDPKKVILVFSHDHNTFDKRKLLNSKNAFVKESDKTVDQFVKQADLKNFYMYEIHELIKDYPSGKPDMKPDVIKQTKEIETRREKEAADNGKIVVQDSEGNSKELTTPEVVNIIKNLQSENEQLKRQSGQNSQIIMQGPDGNDRPLNTAEVTHIMKNMQEEIRTLKSQQGVASNQQERQYIFTNENDEMEIISDNEVNDYVNKLIDKLKSGNNVAPTTPQTDFESAFDSFKNEIKNELKHLTTTNKMQLEINGEIYGDEQLKDLIIQQQKTIQHLTEICKPIHFNDNQGNLTVLTQEVFDAIARVANNNFTTYHDKNDVLNEHKLAHGNSSSNVNFNVEEEDPVCDMDVDESYGSDDEDKDEDKDEDNDEDKDEDDESENASKHDADVAPVGPDAPDDDESENSE